MNNTIKTAYTIPNNIFKVAGSEKQTRRKSTGIHNLKSNTSNHAYIEQTERTIEISCKEVIGYMETNKPRSAYTLNIIYKRQEYGPKEENI